MNKLFTSLSLGLALFFASCSKESHDVVVERSVVVDFSIEADINDEELRGLTLLANKDEKKKPALVDLEKGDKVSLNLVFSNGSSSVARTVEFAVDEEKRLVYKGQIEVPNYTVSAKWYVTAFYGGAKTPSDQVSYDYAPQVFEEGELLALGSGDAEFNMPYASGWTPVEGHTNEKTGAAEGYFKVHLKPLGHLLKVRLKNERDHKILLQGFDIVSDDFLVDVTLTPTTTTAAFEAGAYPIVSKRGENTIRPIYPEELAKGDGVSSGYFMWVMPKSATSTEKTIKLRAVHYKQGGEWYFPFDVKLAAGSGPGLGGNYGLKTLTIKNDHKIYRQLYAIDYVAKGNINSSGIEQPEGDAGHSFTLRSFDTFRKANAERSYMTGADWYEILPRSNASDHLHAKYNGRASNDGTVFFPSTTKFQVFQSESFPEPGSSFGAIGTTTRTLYAVRSLPGNRRAAFRYILEEATGKLSVEMLHLGSIAKTVEHINAEAYWQTAYEYGEVVKRVFPGESKWKGQYTYYMSEIEGNVQTLTMWNSSYGRIGHVSPITDSDAIKARLKHAKPLDLPVNN